MRRLFLTSNRHDLMPVVSISNINFFHRFSAFLNRFRPYLIPTLIRYLEMRKVIKAIEYANALAKKIRWPSQSDHYKFSSLGAASTHSRFDDFASKELLLLVTEALPAFCTYTLVDTVVDCVTRDITGQGIPVFRELVGELAEVFCLTDPSVHDNPIIFASEGLSRHIHFRHSGTVYSFYPCGGRSDFPSLEFHRTTQYGTNYAIDRNCRFLQGPGTDKNCTLRLAQGIARGEESLETLLNYRRDGTPFVNLLMIAPLYDDKGIVRYFIGAQVDVSGLVEQGRGIESFRALLQKEEQNDEENEIPTSKFNSENRNGWYDSRSHETLTKLQELSTMFSQEESDIVFKHSRCVDNIPDNSSSVSNGVHTSTKNRSQSKRIIGTDQKSPSDLGTSFAQLGIGNGPLSCSLPGVYRHYLLVRPFPSLQIIFASPSLRLPGILRTHLFSKLGGPTQTMTALENAFRDGACVTAKVLWLPKNAQSGERCRAPTEARPRFIRCTPLLGSDDRVGVWMVILVPADGDSSSGGTRRHGIIDEMAQERRRLEMLSGSSSKAPSMTGSRRGGSIDEDCDGGIGLKTKPVVRTLSNGQWTRHGRSDDSQLYAEYLRGSSFPVRASEDSGGRHRDHVVAPNG